MDRAEIIKCKEYLLNILRLHKDFDDVAGLKNKVLLVEGSTDKEFMEHIRSDDTKVYSVADIMKARSAFSGSPAVETKQYNSKLVITELLKHISFIPEYISFPKGAEKWPLYGLADNDSDDNSGYSRITKLFFTDTHDIETLMLSTDSGVLTRLQQCSIPDKDLKTALYLSVQLAEFKKAIRKNDSLNIADINEEDGTVDFQIFTDADYRVSPEKLLNHISSRSEERLSKEKLKKVQKSIADDMKRCLDKEGKWKKPLDSFSLGPGDKLWKDVNGHDILSAVCFVNSGAREAFHKEAKNRKNRRFELALINAYDYDCLKNTELYSKLKQADLLKHPYAS